MLGSGSPKFPHPPKRNAAAAYPSPEVDEPSSLVSARPPEVADKRSFESFYEAESRTLFRRLWLVTGNRAEAEEIMQDAFLKLGSTGTAPRTWTIQARTCTGRR